MQDLFLMCNVVKDVRTAIRNHNGYIYIPNLSGKCGS